MKINKRSWHYKLMTTFFAGEPHPRSLCLYFWKVMFCLFVLCPITAILTPIALVVWPIAVGIEWAEGKYYDWKYGEWTLDGALDYRENAKPDGLFVSYYKAIKDKVCPILEYVEIGRAHV